MASHLLTPTTVAVFLPIIISQVSPFFENNSTVTDGLASLVAAAGDAAGGE